MKRSDPKGALVRYDVSSDQPVLRIEVDLEGDGEPSIPRLFLNEPKRDGRYDRGDATKFPVNGTWPLVVTAIDALGRVGSMRCVPGITVGF